MELKPLTLMDVNIERAEHMLPPLTTLEKEPLVPPKKIPLTMEEKGKELRATRKERLKLQEQIEYEKRKVGALARTVNMSRRKQKWADAVLKYLSNPNNKPIESRSEYKDILGLTAHTYKTFSNMFSVSELAEIESQGLELRRRRYANRLAKIDDGLLEKAAEGRAPEAKLAYQRFEGWTEKTVTEVTNTFSLQLDAELAALLEPIKYKGVMDVIPEAETSLLPETFPDSRSQE
jgi:hypothetical protein